jgi:superfamily II DNA or RNA helicase
MDASADLLQESQTPFHRGEIVLVRGDRWSIREAHAFAECRLLELEGNGGSNRGRRLDILCPFDRPVRLGPVGLVRTVNGRQAMRRLREIVATARPFGGLRSAATARIDIHAYQLEPALAVLNGHATRLLLADEVGLGKTVQAGLVVSEMRARGDANRVLILTPAGLRDQWAAELRNRFSIEAPVADAAFLRRSVAELTAGTNPWARFPVLISSLDFVKRAEVLRALDPLVWDLLLVDEAHVCASAVERSSAVRLLASRARIVVLITATPHAGDDSAFASLCSMGSTHARDRLLMFRRDRRRVGIASDRRVRLLAVQPSAAELDMHALLSRYTTAVWNGPGVSRDARLAMVVLLKRSLSSATSLARSLERRMEALFDIQPTGVQFSLPFAGLADPDDRSPEDDEPVGHLSAPGLDGSRERAWLRHLMEAARRAACCESKINRLARLLRQAREPAIVFTEYRDTAQWLAARLANLGPLVVLHGGLSRNERIEAACRFRSGQATLLVGTDAAGEGLNLHDHCRLVVNLELPWNPMRLEQRIGRVDRLGQARRPHAVHLLARGTAEERIVRRLVVRQERARQSVGIVSDAVGAVREEDVAAAVMSGDACRPHRVAEPPGSLLVKSTSVCYLGLLAAEEAARVREIRALSGRHGATGPASVGWDHRAGSTRSSFNCRPFLSTLRKRRHLEAGGLGAGLVCVFVIGLLDRQGQVVDERPAVLHVAPARPVGPVSPAFVGRLAGSTEVRRQIEKLVRARLASIGPLHARVSRVLMARDRALTTVERPRRPLLQPGIFDRRVLVEAEHARQRREQREREWREHAARLDLAARRLTPDEPRLALVLIVP